MSDLFVREAVESSVKLKVTLSLLDAFEDTPPNGAAGEDDLGLFIGLFAGLSSWRGLNAVPAGAPPVDFDEPRGVDVRARAGGAEPLHELALVLDEDILMLLLMLLLRGPETVVPCGNEAWGSLDARLNLSIV